VHYTGFLAGAHALPTPFFSSAEEAGPSGAPAVVIAGRSAAARETGLVLAVAAMHVGEHAEVRVAPGYGYGPSGSFSFPAVPPGAHLRYTVHLVAAEPPDEAKPVGLMLFEERLEAAARRRAAGNEALRRGDHDAAVASYSLALSFIDDDLLIQLEGRHAELAEAEVRAARLNMAAAHLAAGRHREAVAACDAVLGGGGGGGVPSSSSSCPPTARAKALYRRGVARQALGAPGDAVADFKAAAAAAPGDPAIRRALAAAAGEAREVAAAGAALFRGALKKEEEAVAAPVGVIGQQEQQGTAGAAWPDWWWVAAAAVMAAAAAWWLKRP